MIATNRSPPILITNNIIKCPLYSPSYNLPNKSPNKTNNGSINIFSVKDYKLYNNSSPPNMSGSPPNEFMDILKERMQIYYAK